MFNRDDVKIRKGTTEDLDALERLYDEVHDSLESGVNFPGWKRGSYPIREDAEKGILSGCLYVAEKAGESIGTIILNHEQEEAYRQAEWRLDADDKDVLVIHTFAVHPRFQGAGLGALLLGFSEQQGKREGMKSIRLDVYEKNAPANALYKKCGFQCIGKVDLGLRDYGLDWFNLYEKIL